MGFVRRKRVFLKYFFKLLGREGLMNALGIGKVIHKLRRAKEFQCRFRIVFRV